MRRRTEPTPNPAVKRSRPLLGTYVAISVAGLADAVPAIERGFAAVADLHRLMSFHEPGSDISRINRAGAGEETLVDPRTFAVLEQAGQLAAESGGVFDITVAAELVTRGFLPSPGDARAPDPAASWCDIKLTPAGSVRLRRPLWIDLGGIAKGYAVDRAAEAMALPDGAQCSINAGGDLRVSGPEAERVLLRAPRAEGAAVPVVALRNASLASSSGIDDRRRAGGTMVGPHLDARRGHSVGTRSFVSVVADSCMIADGLTKIVLARRDGSGAILRKYGATAYLRDPRGNWRTLGVTA
jgi:thiamine biosynthesis lipoprotein